MSSSLLQIGARSLAAAQGTLSTVSHNIANANTAGYSRQEVLQSTAGGIYTGAGFFGRGVNLETVRRQYDGFLAGTVQANTAMAAADSARSQGLSQLDALFADPELGVGAAIDAFVNAASNLATRSADATTRQAWLSGAQQVAQRITSLGDAMASLAAQANQRLAGEARQVNGVLSEIRALNNSIAQLQSSGQPPNDLLDQRDAALQKLQGLISVQTVAADNATLNIFTASGEALLVGNRVATLTAAADPADPTRAGIRLDTGGLTRWMGAADLAGGSIAGTLRFRDEDLAAASQQLGRIGVVLATTVNAQHRLGVDAKGQPGTDVFTLPAVKAQAHAENTGSGAIGMQVMDASALKASAYEIAWDGTAYSVRRMADGQVTTTATLPVDIDGLRLNGSGAPASGDRWLLKPYEAATRQMGVKPLATSQVATGMGAMLEAGAANKGAARALDFAVVRQTTDNALPVTISFNSPPSTYNVIGLAGGNLMGVPYVPGQRVPAAPADYNGWRVVLDGAPAAGDSFSVRATSAPGRTTATRLRSPVWATSRGWTARASTRALPH